MKNMTFLLAATALTAAFAMATPTQAADQFLGTALAPTSKSIKALVMADPTAKTSAILHAAAMKSQFGQQNVATITPAMKEDTAKNVAADTGGGLFGQPSAAGDYGMQTTARKGNVRQSVIFINKAKHPVIGATPMHRVVAS